MNTVYAARDAKKMVERGEEFVLPVQPSTIIRDWFNKQSGFAMDAKFVKITDGNRVACAAITGVEDLLEFAMAQNYTIYFHRAMLKVSDDKKYNKEVYQQKQMYYFRMEKKPGA